MLLQKPQLVNAVDLLYHLFFDLVDLRVFLALALFLATGTLTGAAFESLPENHATILSIILIDYLRLYK